MADLDMPLCVKFEGHYLNRTTCSECWPYWNTRAERDAPREHCRNDHAHESHGWMGGDTWHTKWCTGVEHCPEVERLTGELAAATSECDHALQMLIDVVCESEPYDNGLQPLGYICSIRPMTDAKKWLIEQGLIVEGPGGDLYRSEYNPADERVSSND